MTREEREAYVQKLILEKLAQTTFLVPRPTLEKHVNLLENPRISDPEIDAALEAMKGRGWVDSQKPAVGPERWKITDDGRAALREL